MASLQPINRATASQRAQQLLGTIEQRIGRSSNMLGVMANSPAILETYTHFNQAFEQTVLSGKTRALITMAIAQLMGCEYTLSIGVALSGQEGLSVEDLEAARRGESSDPKIASALRFAIHAVEANGQIEPSEVDSLHEAGYDDQEIVEIIAAIALILFRNYFNLIAETKIDFPLVKVTEPLRKSPAQ